MPIAKITGGGLSCIAMLVLILWACILGEHVIMQRANQEYSRAMTEIRVLQRKHLEPVSSPAAPRPVHSAIG